MNNEASTPEPQQEPTNKKRALRRHADTMLVFDPAQKVPDSVLNAIVEEWLVPCLVEQFLRERGITRESLFPRYRTPKEAPAFVTNRNPELHTRF